MSLCQRSVLWCPAPKQVSLLKHVAVSKSFEELARKVAGVQGQLSGKEEDSDTSGENGPLPVPQPAQVVSGRGHDRLRLLVNLLMCRDARSKESFMEQRAVRTLVARKHHQTARGKFLMFVQKRTLPLVEDVESDGALVAYSNDRSVHGVERHNGSQLLAAVVDRWLSFSRFGSSKLPNNPLHVAVFILILQVTCMRPSELLTLRRILSHRLCHFSHIGRS